MKILIKIHETMGDEIDDTYALVNITKEKARRFLSFMTRLTQLKKQFGSGAKSANLTELVFGSQQTPAFAEIMTGMHMPRELYTVVTNQEIFNPYDKEWEGHMFVKVMSNYTFRQRFKVSGGGLNLHITSKGICWTVDDWRTYNIPRGALEIMAVRE